MSCRVCVVRSAKLGIALNVERHALIDAQTALEQYTSVLERSSVFTLDSCLQVSAR